MNDRRIRIAAVGDHLLAGAGDARAIGWWGRVLARTQAPGVELENYVLAVPHETTEDLNERWWGEASRRYSDDTENRLVVALSDADLDLEASSTARSRLNLANVLDTASQRGIPVLVVGPTPTLDEERNARLARLDVPVSRALVFGGVTRNSLVVLPLALALPERLALTPFVVVTQTLVELVGMVVLVRLVPALVRDRDPRHSGGTTPSHRKAPRP